MAATCGKCTRPSCRPDEYEALCTKHYLADVEARQASAAKAFQARLTPISESTFTKRNRGEKP